MGITMGRSAAGPSVGRMLFAGAVAALLVVGCSSTPDKDAAGTMETGSEFSEGAAAYNEGSDLVIEPSLQTIYFGYDRAEIREDAKPLLRANAQEIQANPAWGRITIEGHCDERGSEEYNLALGERRANAVKRYLVDLGVPSSRLDTVSFGESKPAVMGHDESAWRWNRRADFARVQ